MMDTGMITGCVGVASDPRRTWDCRRDTCKYSRNKAALKNAHTLLPEEDVYISGYNTTCKSTTGEKSTLKIEKMPSLGSRPESIIAFQDLRFTSVASW